MNQKPISELRRRLLEDMAVRNFSEATQRNYIHHIARACQVPGTVSRHGNRGGRTPLPGTYDRGWRATAKAQQCHFGDTLLSWNNSIGPSSPGIWPACTIRGRYRVCCRPAQPL
jgi:hypothetical protein